GRARWRGYEPLASRKPLVFPVSSASNSLVYELNFLLTQVVTAVLVTVEQVFLPAPDGAVHGVGEGSNVLYPRPLLGRQQLLDNLLEGQGTFRLDQFCGPTGQ